MKDNEKEREELREGGEKRVERGRREEETGEREIRAEERVRGEEGGKRRGEIRGKSKRR